MDVIQKRIEFLKATIRLLKVIVEFVSGYFPTGVDLGDNKLGVDLSWEFYNNEFKK